MSRDLDPYGHFMGCLLLAAALIALIWADDSDDVRT